MNKIKIYWWNLNPMKLIQVFLVFFLLFQFGFANECQTHGFTENLMCTTCKKMSNYVEDKKLLDQCQKCCTEEKQTGKYIEGRLEVCS